MKKELIIGIQIIAIGFLFLIMPVSCKKDNNNNPTTVSDFDGNVYNTITIGTQSWIKENLKVTHYNNGDAIPNITDGLEWSNLTTGAYCDYDNIPNNSTTFGRLYNWYAVSQGNLCPIGWHIPSDSEWATLVDYLGGESIAGGKLKEVGTIHWESPNTGATNETGFTALPSGARWNTNPFSKINNSGWWWSSTEHSADFAWYQTISTHFIKIEKLHYSKRGGFAVRCVED